MGRQKPAIKFPASMEVEAAGPLDARTVVPTKADLTLASNFPYAYAGLTVYVEAEQKSYILTADDATILANWKEIGSSVTVDQSYNAASTNAQSGTAVAEAIIDRPGLTVRYSNNKQTAGLEANGKALVFQKPDDAEEIEIGMLRDGRAVLNSYVVPTKTYVDTALSDRYTKSQTDAKIAYALTDVAQEHFHVVTALPNPLDVDPDARPKENHEYVLVSYEQDGTTIATEEHFLFYGGEYHKRTTTVSLDGYATEQYVDEALSHVTIDVDQSYDPTSTDPQSGTAVAGALALKQDALVSGTNLKTVGNVNLLGSGDVEFKTINHSSISGSGNLSTGRVAADSQSNSIAIYEGTDNSIQISKVDTDTIRVQGYGVDDRGSTRTLYDMSLANKEYVDAGLAKSGDLSELLTTDQSDLVSAINEVYEKSGEPFRAKQWTINTLDVTIPVCTSDVGNTSIPKLVFTIDDTEGADYQIIGMISYEVFDAASGGNRINCWPVCQFTGNNQKELSVRFMCAGSTEKTAKRLSAWVLLKHR